jgi:phospholipase/lecithinase/hemolysin
MIARVALALVAATAAAQAAPPASLARPASPEDPERAAEARSLFWDEVAHPGARAHDEQIADAIRALRLTSADLSAVERG